MIKDLAINAAMLVSFVSLGNQFFRGKEAVKSESIGVRLFSGLMSGILGILLIVFSVHISDTVIVDFRNITIILSAIYGGGLSVSITALIIGVFRLTYLGIDGTSIIAFLVLIFMALGCALICKLNISIAKKWVFCVIFSMAASGTGFFLLVKDFTHLINILAYFWIGTIVIAFLLYYYVEYLVDLNKQFRRLKEESSKDFLTGLNNVRSFDNAFNKAMEYAKEKGERLSLLLLDIDFFKRVNDTYGHIEGDNVLKDIGSLLKKACRNFDVISRNGGEEFSVILLDCPANQAVEVAERIRNTIQEHYFLLKSQEQLKLTVSVGVSSFPDTTREIDKLFEQADTALYNAKLLGRNKVVLATFEKENLKVCKIVMS